MELGARLAEAVEGVLHPCRVVALKGLLRVGERPLHLRLLLGRHLVARVLERLLKLVDRRVELVADLDGVAALLVVGRIQLGLLCHLVDFVLREARGALDRDLLVLAGAQVLGGHVQDAVCVDVERDLDLRGAAGRGRDAVETERAQRLVVAGHRALALEDHDLNRGLVVAVGREHLRLLGRDRRVARDHRRGHVARGHDAERERRHVQQKDVAHVALEDAALDRGADRDDLVGVHALVRLLAAERLGDVDHLRHAGHPADEHELVDLGRREIGVLQAVLEGLDAALEETVADLLHLGAGQLHVEVLGARCVRRDERKVDVDRLGRGERDLRLLRLLLEALQGHRILPQVDAVLLLEIVHEPGDEGVIPVVAAQVRVPVGRLDLEDAVADLEHGHVERPAAQVEHRDLLVLLLVEAVGQRSRRGLVDDAKDLEARDLAGVLGRLALRVVEVRRHRDDRLRDLFAEVGLGVRLQLAQDERGDLLGGKLLRLVAELDLDVGVAVLALDDLERHVLRLLADLGEFAADEALRGIDRVARIGDGLPLGGLSDDALPRLRECDHRRGRARALRVRNDNGLPAFHDRHAGVGGP